MRQLSAAIIGFVDTINICTSLKRRGGDLLGNVFRASDKDLLSSMLINDRVSGSVNSYYESGYENDLLARGECLFRKKKRSRAILAKRRILF